MISRTFLITNMSESARPSIYCTAPKHAVPRRPVPTAEAIVRALLFSDFPPKVAPERTHLYCKNNRPAFLRSRSQYPPLTLTPPYENEVTPPRINIRAGMSRSADPSNGRSLLDQPPELRLRMYHLCLVQQRSFSMRHESWTFVKSDNADWRILQTCQQIHTEAVRVLYEDNVFDFQSLGAFLLHSADRWPQYSLYQKDPILEQKWLGGVLAQRRPASLAISTSLDRSRVQIVDQNRSLRHRQGRHYRTKLPRNSQRDLIYSSDAQEMRPTWV